MAGDDRLLEILQRWGCQMAVDARDKAARWLEMLQRSSCQMAGDATEMELPDG